MLKTKFIIKCFSIFLLFIFLFSPICSFASISNIGYTWTEIPDSILTSISQTEKENTSELSLESGSAILIEQNSGKVLYEQNCHEKLRPASVTKIMSLLLIMDALDSEKITLQTKIPCTEDAAAMGGSQIWLDPREELSVDEMLKAICVVSANDCDVQK